MSNNAAISAYMLRYLSFYNKCIIGCDVLQTKLVAHIQFTQNKYLYNYLYKIVPSHTECISQNTDANNVYNEGSLYNQ